MILYHVAKKMAAKIQEKMIWWISICVIFVSTLMPALLQGATTTVTAQINNGTVTIGGPTSLAFSTPLTVSFSSQSFEQEFTGTSNYFRVQDMKWLDSWYNTTLQIAGNLTTGAYSIASGNVSFKVTSTTPVLMSGTANPRVLIDSNTSAYQPLHVARTYIYRSAALNTGVISKYGQSIFLKIDVPANQPAGAYSGTVVYTLIEN